MSGWEAQFARLVAYKAVHGDCNVPGSWSENPRGRPLGQWVKGQRKLKLKLDRGEPIRSERLVAERAARLTALGLVSDRSSGSQRAGTRGQAP